MAERADQILDAAGELLLRHGYRKVTVADVADRAGVGKGTVYLHWKTKTALFQALLVRESAALLQEMLAALRDDPEQVRPHRLLRMAYVGSHRRPLVLALVTGDSGVLGSLREHAPQQRLNATNQHFYDVLAEHGLLRDDLPDLAYAVNATTLGFFLAEDYRSDLGSPALEARADALARTVRLAFEPAAEPGPAALRKAAGEVEQLFAEVLDTYRALLRSLDAAREPR